VTGSLTVEQDGVKVTVEWPGGALMLTQFTEVLEAVTRAWVAVQGYGSTRVLFADAMTYEAGDDDP
jgi:hypothetical protein